MLTAVSREKKREYGSMFRKIRRMAIHRDEMMKSRKPRKDKKIIKRKLQRAYKPNKND